MTDVMMIQPLFIGTTELLLIGGMALLLFGGKKLPEMMRGLGQGVKEFKKGMNEINASLEEESDGGAMKEASEVQQPQEKQADGSKKHGE